MITLQYGSMYYPWDSIIHLSFSIYLASAVHTRLCTTSSEISCSPCHVQVDQTVELKCILDDNPREEFRLCSEDRVYMPLFHPGIPGIEHLNLSTFSNESGTTIHVTFWVTDPDWSTIMLSCCYRKNETYTVQQEYYCLRYNQSDPKGVVYIIIMSA